MIKSGKTCKRLHLMEGRMLLNRDPALKMRHERGMLHLCSSVKHDDTFFNVAINRESIPWLIMLHDTQILLVNIKKMVPPGWNWPSWKADNHVAFDTLMPYKADQKVQLGWSAV